MSHIRTALDYVHKTTACDSKLAACRGGEDRQVVGRREGGEDEYHHAQGHCCCSTQRVSPKRAFRFNAAPSSSPNRPLQPRLMSMPIRFRREEGVKSSQVKSSTFDRLPYGCLLFMYRLDLTCVKGCEGPTRNTDYNCRRETVSAFFHQDFLKSKNLFISS